MLKGETFRSAIEEAESQLSLAKFSLRETHGEEIDVNLLLAYAESFIQTVEKVWYDAPFGVRKKIQNFVLPGGLYVTKTREGYFFSNPGISGLFQLIQDFGVEDSTVVTLSLPHPNQIISDLMDLISTFLPDVQQLGLHYSV